MSEWVREPEYGLYLRREYGLSFCAEVELTSSLGWRWRIYHHETCTLTRPAILAGSGYKTSKAAMQACDEAFVRYAAAVKEAAEGVAPTGAGG